MKIGVLFLLLMMNLLSCNGNYVYREISEFEVMENKKTLIQSSSSHNFYSVCKDYGAPVNDRCFLAIQKGGKYFKINPKYRYAIGNDCIYLFQRVSLNYSEKGNWVLIERKNINGKENIYFNYDTIPSITIPELSNGVFSLKNNNFEKVGELSNFKSFHDLPSEGFYYLSSPGIFYEKSVNFSEIK